MQVCPSRRAVQHLRVPTAISQDCSARTTDGRGKVRFLLLATAEITLIRWSGTRQNGYGMKHQRVHTTTRNRFKTLRDRRLGPAPKQGTATHWRWTLGLAVAVLFGAVLTGCGDDTDDDSGDELTIAVENAYLPFNYLDPETGEPTGWDYEVLEEICERIGCTPVFENFPWEPMIQAVADGQFDMAADGITITDERAEIVDFSDSTINVEQRLMVRKGEDRFTDSSSFEEGDFVLGTQIGTTNYNTGVELVGEDRVQPFEEFGFVIQSLIAGDVDAVIIDEVAGQGYIGENADQVELIGGSLSSDQLGFIFPKGSKWVAPINEALAEMKSDGKLEEISSRYFGSSFTITYDDLEFPEYDEE